MLDIVHTIERIELRLPHTIPKHRLSPLAQCHIRARIGGDGD